MVPAVTPEERTMTGQQITNGARIVRNGKNVTVYAHWVGMNGKVEMMVEGPRGGMDAMVVGVDEVVATW